MLEACENYWQSAWNQYRSLIYGPGMQQDKLQTYKIKSTKYVQDSVLLNDEVSMSVNECVCGIPKK